MPARHAAGDRAVLRPGGYDQGKALWAREFPSAGSRATSRPLSPGQACFRAGLSKNTYGTGCFALTHAGGAQPRSTHRLLGTRAAARRSTASREFAVEGSVFVAGAVIQWLRDRTGSDPHRRRNPRPLAVSVPDSGGVHVVPAFVGLGAPHWDSAARGVICGLTRASSKAHIVRAALESIAFQSKDLIDAMEADSGQPIRSCAWMAGRRLTISSCNSRPIFWARPSSVPPMWRPPRSARRIWRESPKASGRGSEEVESFWRVERRFDPQMSGEYRTGRTDGRMAGSRVARTL